MKKNLFAALVLLFMNGCFGSNIIGGVPIPWQPIGEWLLEDVIGLDIKAKSDSLKDAGEMIVKQYVDDQLAAVAPHVVSSDEQPLLEGEFSRKNGGNVKFLLYPTGWDEAILEIVSDSDLVIYELTKAVDDENLKTQKRLMQKMEKLGEALKKKKEDPDR